MGNDGVNRIYCMVWIGRVWLEITGDRGEGQVKDIDACGCVNGDDVLSVSRMLLT